MNCLTRVIDLRWRGFALSAVVLLGSCSASGGEAVVDAGDASSSAGFEGSPIDAILMADGRYLRQEQGIYDERRSCMEEAGYSFLGQRPSATNLVEDRDLSVALLSLEDAEASGFHRLRSGSGGVAPEGTVQPSPPGYEETLALCTQESKEFNRARSDEYLASRSAFERRLLEFEASFNADGEIIELRKNWSGCSSDSGYASDSPGDFLDRYAAETTNEPTNEDVKSAALTYASCLQDTSYASLYQVRRNELEHEFVNANSEIINEMLQARYSEDQP